VDATDNPRDPDTFNADASFILRPDGYFPGYYVANLVSDPELVWTGNASRQGPVTARKDDNSDDELHMAASWAVFDRGSIRRTKTT